MWTTTIRPRYNETDAQGHINNTVLPVWFLEAREPVIALFAKDSPGASSGLAVVHMEVSYHAETHFGSPVTVVTSIGEIRNKAFQIIQRCWQNGTLTATGVTTLVSFDMETRQGALLTQAQRELLGQHHDNDAAQAAPV